MTYSKSTGFSDTDIVESAWVSTPSGVLNVNTLSVTYAVYQRVNNWVYFNMKVSCNATSASAVRVIYSLTMPVTTTETMIGTCGFQGSNNNVYTGWAQGTGTTLTVEFLNAGSNNGLGSMTVEGKYLVS